MSQNLMALIAWFFFQNTGIFHSAWTLTLVLWILAFMVARLDVLVLYEISIPQATWVQSRPASLSKRKQASSKAFTKAPLNAKRNLAKITKRPLFLRNHQMYGCQLTEFGVVFSNKRKTLRPPYKNIIFEPERFTQHIKKEDQQ